MASTIKQISDALISRIASQVTGLNTRTVRPFAGFGSGEVMNFPFVGVTYDGGPFDNLTSDNVAAVQTLRFKLSIAGEDFRGTVYTIESSHVLIESLITALKAQQLGLAIEPIRIVNIAPDQFMLDRGITVYVMEIETTQVRS